MPWIGCANLAVNINIFMRNIYQNCDLENTNWYYEQQAIMIVVSFPPPEQVWLQSWNARSSLQQVTRTTSMQHKQPTKFPTLTSHLPIPKLTHQKTLVAKTYRKQFDTLQTTQLGHSHNSSDTSFKCIAHLQRNISSGMIVDYPPVGIFASGKRSRLAGSILRIISMTQ